MSSNVRWFLGLVASILVALSANLDKLPESLRTYFAVGGIIGTAVTAYMIQRPREEWTDEKREAVRKVEAAKEEAEVKALKDEIKKS